MRLGLPALAAGLLALRFLAELPSVGWLLGMAAAGLLLLFGRLYWLGLFLLGFAWACGSAQVALDGRLAAELDGRTLWLEGRVVDLPASGEGVTRFRLEEVSAARGVLLPERLRPEEASLRDRQRRLPVAELEAFSQSGLWGISVPRAYGGAEVGYRTLAEVLKIIAAVDPSLAQLPQNHLAVLDHLRLDGSEEQKRFFYGLVLDGVRFGNAFSERHSRTVAEFQTRVLADGDGFRIDGRKFYSSGALLAHWVPAVGLDAEQRAHLAFIPRDAPGLTVIDDWSGFGQRTSLGGAVELALAVQFVEQRLELVVADLIAARGGRRLALLRRRSRWSRGSRCGGCAGGFRDIAELALAVQFVEQRLELVVADIVTSGSRGRLDRLGGDLRRLGRDRRRDELALAVQLVEQRLELGVADLVASGSRGRFCNGGGRRFVALQSIQQLLELVVGDIAGGTLRGRFRRRRRLLDGYTPMSFPLVLTRSLACPATPTASSSPSPPQAKATARRWSPSSMGAPRGWNCPPGTCNATSTGASPAPAGTPPSARKPTRWRFFPGCSRARPPARRSAC